MSSIDFFNGFKELDILALTIENQRSASGFDSLIPSEFSVSAINEVAMYAQSSSSWKKLSKTGIPKDFGDSIRRAYRDKGSVRFTESDDVSTGCLSLPSKDTFVVHELQAALNIAARKSMQFKRSKADSQGRVCGAINEMLDNVIDHSDAAHTSLIVYQGTSSWFEASIGDAGKGVLASLRMNPALGFLTDYRQALDLAIQDGVSRYPGEEGKGHGHGFRTLISGLVTLGAEIRVRSGDAALEISTGAQPFTRISDQAHLQGMVVSFRVKF
jgi:hypothetical protein